MVRCNRLFATLSCRRISFLVIFAQTAEKVQYLPTAVSGSTATKLFFSQTHIKEIREIQRTVVGKTSGGEADHLAGVLRGLAPLSCVLHSKQHRPFARLTLKPYFERHP